MRISYKLPSVFFVFFAVLSIVTFSKWIRPTFAQTQNRPPVAVADSYTVHGSVITPTGANVLDNDYDPDGNSLQVDYQTPTSVPGVGTFSVGYTGVPFASGGPNPGTAVIPYSISDGSAGASSTVTFNVVNSPPTAVTDIYVVAGNNLITETGKGPGANDFDADGDAIGVDYQALTNLPNGAGVYSIVDGRLSVPRQGTFSGIVVIGYTIFDSIGKGSWGEIVLVLPPRDDAGNAGQFCPSLGKPVNVTNGNMWLEEKDYELPGVGENISVNRFYNSVIQYSGLFGFGWSTKYDESIVIYPDDRVLELKLPDGRMEYFGRSDTSSPFHNLVTSSGDRIAKNADATFTVNFSDGRIHHFDSGGRQLWQKDRNGNQTTLSYNTSGQLTGISDPFGRTLTVTPNADGTIAQISDAIVTVATYEYYPSTTLLKSVTYPDNSKYTFEYDSSSAAGKVLLKTVKDALSNVLETHLYDSAGRAITSEVHGGVEKYTFDYSHHAETIPYTIATDALGRVTKYYFDKSKFRNVLTKTEGVCSCGGSGSELTTFEYDSKLNLTKKTDALGHETTYTYNSSGDVLTQTDILGTQTFTYNSLGEVLTASDRMGGVTTNTYSTNGNLLTTKDPLNNTTTFTYTSLGQLETIKDALNHTTTLVYDTSGRLSQIKDANNKITTFGYDSRARVTSVTNALNETTGFEYDPRNRLNKVTYPDSNLIQFSYDLAGRRTGFTDARNNTTTYGYDNAYRLNTITDALNHATTFGYDLMSNVTSKTDAVGNTSNLEYDDFDRLTKVTYPPAYQGATRLEESATYDKVDNLKTRVDTAGKTTSYDYDAANRLIKITDALNQITQFEYNARSQMTKVIDALNQQYAFTYDPLGRKLSETRAGTTMSFEYDAVGNRTKRTDHMGRVTTYEYDVLNRLKKISYLLSPIDPQPAIPGPTATYNYDDLSRLTSAVNEAGAVSFTYDNRNRVKTETDVFGHIIEYGYDLNGNRNLLKFDGSDYASYIFDAANRLTSITNSADSSVITYGYDNANRLSSRTYPNGVSTTYEFDGMSRIKRLKDVSAMATLFDRQYSYNAANQISQIVEPSRTRVFSYDDIDRLTGVTDATNGNESYVFDAVGNRTSSHLSNTYTYSPFNRLTATQTATYSFDANGSTVSKSEGSNRWSYIWDYENRLTQASTRKQKVRYKFDAVGRRVQRIINYGQENTKFIYDGLDVIADDNYGTLTKYQNGPGIDNKLRVQTGSDVKYFLADHLGSTNGLADGSGSLAASTAYDSFGNSTNSNFPTRYQYTGREFDNFTGMQFSRARWYEAKIGRFTSEDPIRFLGDDLNLYGYLRNKPLAGLDPYGLFPIWDDYWRAYYSIKCAETGMETACSFNHIGQSQQELEIMAQQAFNRGAGNLSGLRFREGYGNNEFCRQAEYYAGQEFMNYFPTNVQRVDPNGSVQQTLEDIARRRQLSNVQRAWNWVRSWF